MPVLPVTVFYLHGFASSPRSTKVAFFTERLAGHHVEVRCPDFNLPDFQTLTMTRMLDQLNEALASAPASATPVTLFGSSLGGTLAMLAAARWPARIDRLVLLAPAVMFAKPGHHLLPPERIEEWRRKGALPFFHYADNAERPLNFTFYEDSLRYDAFGAAITQPTMIFQGLHDTSVDHRTVEAFARTRPTITLSLLDDDHQLIKSLPRIWNDVALFLGLVE
ncbi:MAG: alpha/beta fold hydrolase [Acidobacteriia bacterium]|nr:alpha/beta fold hydrolase [Terriglobia bacterium]